ncbi:MAG TPA: ketopantoate reductase C-terminal domain-containing protein, partial [Chthoniobacterales bacterium]
LVKVLPPLLKPGTWIVTLQNGLGNEEWLAQTFGTDRVLGGLCFVCLNRKQPAVVEHLGYGQITLGDYARFPRPFVHDLCFHFRSCGVPCRPVANLFAARWEKLAWNIPFNGLCIAAGGVPVSAVLADAALSARARVLMEEVVAGGRACGCFLPASLPSTLMERTKAMGDYRPSSLIDYEAGRSLELESIWVEPLRRARAAGLELPALAGLCEELRAKESKRREA